MLFPPMLSKRTEPNFSARTSVAWQARKAALDTRFARMARGEIVGAGIPVTRGNLLEYCKLDTVAMVGLHKKLMQLAE